MAHEFARVTLGLFALSACVLAAPARAQTPEPDGNEFQVNAFTSGDQHRPALATDAAGNFVVVWRSNFDVYARRFDSGGNALGSEFLVNSYSTGTQNYPRVAMDASGDFVVVWNSDGQDGSGYGAFGRRFSSAGIPLGSEFQVNSYTTGSQDRPRVAMDAGGNFVVVWHSNGQDGSSLGVFGRHFDSGGNPLGSEFQVNSYTTNNQDSPALTMDAGGNFVVVWESVGQDGSSLGAFGRRFDSGGNPLSPDFQINSYTTSNQILPVVAMDADGKFVVVWESNGPDGSAYGVFARRFDASGTPQAIEFQVNSYTSGVQFRTSIATDADSNFVVVWESMGQDGSGEGLFGRHFDATGSPGPEFQINSYTTNNQRVPAIAMEPGGNFVVVWISTGQDGSGYGVFGQRFVPSDLIFADGVDSGDLTRWSSSVTDGTDLMPTVAAAMAGTAFGLQASVNDTNSLYVVDNTPVLEKRYRARFYFDPNGFDPGEASSHFRTRIFIAFDPSGLRVITVVLKRQGGAYTVETRVRRNDGTRADTGFLPITDGPHVIEFNWRRATGSGAIDGSLEMWIDGTSMATLSGIDNDLSSVDFARLGALAVKTGAAGTLFFDQFDSRRRNYIGP